jgi:murein DD-endopeptidase MepM/ murein hydrolase activator NlpD
MDLAERIYFQPMNTEALLKQLRVDTPIVPFNEKEDRVIEMDFTSANTSLTEAILTDTPGFSGYITKTLQDANARYGIGGYNEYREIYSRSAVFDAGDSTEEPRRLHLGIDIWGKAGTEVRVPLNGKVHSYAFNDHFGDYGATIILTHEVSGTKFHSLYGHLSLADLKGLYEGMPVTAGQTIAHFGMPHENGEWPPHLHFQLIIDMEGRSGDYPGVCKLSEREKYLANCPDGRQLTGF